jgi:PEP-CTERM motif-containing protein
VTGRLIVRRDRNNPIGYHHDEVSLELPMKKISLLLPVAALLTANVQAALVLNDSFSYSDGPIVGAPGSPWATHSGTAGQANVVSGQLSLTESESEDVNSALSGGPYTVASGAVLYSSFTVSFSALPSGGGAYFAHFRDTGTGFRARVFTSTTNAALGSFRFGIGNSSSATVTSGQIATDLNLNTTYTVVTRYDVASGLSTIWLNPTAETDPSVTASDTPGTIDISSYAFRQSLATGSGMGNLTVDDLRVGTTFAEVVPEPSTIVLLCLGAVGLMSRRLRR